MRKFFNGYIALGFAMGMVALLIGIKVTSYQSDVCEQINSQKKAAPGNNKPYASAEDDKNRDGEEPKSHQHGPISCGIAGIPRTIALLMNRNEGLFVGTFTGLLVIATIFLWKSTDRIVINADANASKQLRAYVHVEKVTAYHMNAWAEPNIEVRIRNFGQTPARDISIVYRYAPGITHGFNMYGATHGQIADLAPSQLSRFIIRINAGDWTILKHSVTTHSTTFRVYGYINYFDVFGKSWQTEFRELLLPRHQIITWKEPFVVEGRDGNVTT